MLKAVNTVSLFVFLSILSSCSESDYISNPKIESNELVDTVLDKSSSQELVEEEVEAVMTDQFISFVLPNDYGIYLSDEISFSGDQLVGFYLDSGIVFKSSELIITPRKDEMNDAEGEMSLSHIVCKESGEIPNIVLQGFYNLEDRFIPFYSAAKKSLMPGESMVLDGYSFKAYGVIEEDGTTISNYEIIMEGERNGQFIEQRILFLEYFDDAFVNFHWIADIDMDGIPDFLIDLSHKYSYSLPTLFLSSNAGFGELVKDVDEEAVYGC